MQVHPRLAAAETMTRPIIAAGNAAASAAHFRRPINGCRRDCANSLIGLESSRRLPARRLPATRPAPVPAAGRDDRVVNNKTQTIDSIAIVCDVCWRARRSDPDRALSGSERISRKE